MRPPTGVGCVLSFDLRQGGYVLVMRHASAEQGHRERRREAHVGQILWNVWPQPLHEGAIGSTKTIENDHGLALSRKRNPSMWSPFLGRPEAT